ncbi:thiol:disulfide interchange protein DsbC [Marinospirillum celere]|uniref:Thiol:disulfide interchange protein n=1 Tax=Marinospirillum celere TaxID=1122252 RepID=A0A1I1HCQ0_9GAMM|nr:DsbC family protein [Marinospirillum celere]SFC21787.1 thiol:disulfide interchange protein DsbC [Marinospirillum celere]
MRSFSARLAIAGLLSVFLAVPLQAAPDKAHLEEQLQVIDSRIAIESLESTPLEGIYEVLLNSGDLLYVSADGRFLFAGNLLELSDQGIKDLTENKRSQLRRQQLQDLPEEEQVVFPVAAGQETQAVIQVFTDITCPYCVRLHEEMADLNAAGIEVRYLAFPRQGVGSSAYQKLVNVWCAANPREAMNQAKSGEEVAAASCDNPVASHFELARAQGIQGTPAIILPDGKVIPGYVPSERLIQELGL